MNLPLPQSPKPLAPIAWHWLDSSHRYIAVSWLDGCMGDEDLRLTVFAVVQVHDDGSVHIEHHDGASAPGVVRDEVAVDVGRWFDFSGRGPLYETDNWRFELPSWCSDSAPYPTPTAGDCGR